MVIDTRYIYIFQNLKVNLDWKSISHYCMSFSFGFLFSISLGIRVWDFFENRYSLILDYLFLSMI